MNHVRKALERARREAETAENEHWGRIVLEAIAPIEEALAKDEAADEARPVKRRLDWTTGGPRGLVLIRKGQMVGMMERPLLAAKVAQAMNKEIQS